VDHPGIHPDNADLDPLEEYFHPDGVEVVFVERIQFGSPPCLGFPLAFFQNVFSFQQVSTGLVLVGTLIFTWAAISGIVRGVSAFAKCLTMSFNCFNWLLDACV
jgi:hypothetical protein